MILSARNSVLATLCLANAIVKFARIRKKRTFIVYNDNMDTNDTITIEPMESFNDLLTGSTILIKAEYMARDGGKILLALPGGEAVELNIEWGNYFVEVPNA